jgi:hypothetical protein
VNIIQIMQARNYRTEVYHNNGFLYQSGNHPEIEREHIEEILQALEIHLVKVEIVNYIESRLAMEKKIND